MLCILFVNAFLMMFFFFKQKTAYEMRISDWSSDVCSSDLGGERQLIPLQNRLGASHPKLTQAVLLMEANIEEPLTTDEIAQHVCVSRRQLERIFKQYLNRVPSQYYLELRLNKARQMLMQTSKSIIQIGLSCGFSSGPHFSSAYRNFFGATPRADRNQRRRSSPFELSSVPSERGSDQHNHPSCKGEIGRDAWRARVGTYG